jgi:hypothetical protein
VGRAVPRGPERLWAEGSRGAAGGAGTGVGAGAALPEWKDRHGAGLTAFKRGPESDLRGRALRLSSQAVTGAVGADIELLTRSARMVNSQ